MFEWYERVRGYVEILRFKLVEVLVNLEVVVIVYKYKGRFLLELIKNEFLIFIVLLK